MAQNFPNPVTIYREQRGHELYYFYMIEGVRHNVAEPLALQAARSGQATIRTPDDRSRALMARLRDRTPRRH